MSAEYHYFKPRGKWQYSGEGTSIPIDGQRLTHDRIWELNGGQMPGITGRAYDLTVVVIDPDSFPRMVPSLGEWEA